MKRRTCFFMALCLAAAMSAGCAQKPGNDTDDKEKIRVVTTIFPAYDWVREITGSVEDGPEVTLLLENGTDLHSYQPTAADILKISDCDLFIYVGGESDEWVKDVLKGTRRDMKAISLTEVLGDRVRMEETVEGMEEESGHDDEEAPDEHVWLSLRNASLICGEIASVLAEADPDRADVYLRNAEAYRQKLADLDERYAEVCREAKISTLLFGDRFPFRYLTEDCGLSYYAAFPGCSAETEASFETVIFLAHKMDELRLPVIMTIEGSDQRIARTILDNSEDRDRKILSLDSLQSVTAAKIREGMTYLSVMEKNLEVLKEALDVK